MCAPGHWPASNTARLVGGQVDAAVAEQLLIEHLREGAGRVHPHQVLHGKHSRHARPHQPRRKGRKGVSGALGGRLATGEVNQAQRSVVGWRCSSRRAGRRVAQMAGQRLSVFICVQEAHLVVAVGQEDDGLLVGLAPRAVGDDVQHVRAVQQAGLDGLQRAGLRRQTQIDRQAVRGAAQRVPLRIYVDRLQSEALQPGRIGDGYQNLEAVRRNRRWIILGNGDVTRKGGGVGRSQIDADAGFRVAGVAQQFPGQRVQLGCGSVDAQANAASGRAAANHGPCTGYRIIVRQQLEQAAAGIGFQGAGRPARNGSRHVAAAEFKSVVEG